MSSTIIKIIIIANNANISQSSPEVRLLLTDKLSEVREKLEKHETAFKMNDKLSFSQKVEKEFVEISHIDEENISLVDIIEKVLRALTFIT
jgi:hypothetical protein